MLNDCTLCRLGDMTQNHSNCIKGRGSSTAKVMFIGEAPGKDEDLQALPFVGRAGQKLDDLISRAGLDAEDVFITNICRCRPPENRAPKPDEIETCKPYLLSEIERINPKVLVLLGNTALRLLGSGFRTVSKERGEIYPWNGRQVLITYHPAALLRKWEDEEVVLSDLKLIPRMLNGGVNLGEVDYRVIKTLEGLEELSEELCNCKEFAFDLETTSFDWREEEILCISFCHEPFTAFVVPLLGQERAAIWTSEDLPHVHHILRKIFASDTQKIGQNYKFDAKFLKFHLGAEVKNVSFDTSLAAHLINENLPKNLEFLASYYLGVPRHDKELRAILTSRDMTFDKVPTNILWKYNAGDADTTLQIKQLFEPQVNMNLMNHVCLPLADALMKMEMCGVYIDQTKLESNSKEYAEKIQIEEQKIYKAVGKEFNLGSPIQLGQLLFSSDGLGLPSAGMTGAGNYCTGREELEELSKKLKAEGQVPPEKLEVLGGIVHYRNLRHWKTTFIDGGDGEKGLKRWIHPDGRIYPNYSQIGTDMGRIACREPNLQNIPRNQELRNQFAAPPGWKFVHGDFSQAEARAGAIVANCQGLLNAMRNGLDIHRTAAAKLRKIPYDSVTKEQRNLVKFVTHGLHYGRGIPSIADEYELPLQEVEDFVVGYFNEYPELAQLMLEQVRKVDAGEPILNAFGRQRHFPPKITGHERRVAISHAFASSWADAMNLATSRVIRRFEKEGWWFNYVKCTMTLHDALFFEVRDDYVTRAVPIIIEELEAPVPELQDYKFPMELEVGQCWEDPAGEVVWKGK